MCVLDVEMNCTSFDLKIGHSSDTSVLGGEQGDGQVSTL